MEIPKSLLGAILVGITLQMSSCDKDKNEVQPCKTEQCEDAPETVYDCPNCGMG